MAAGPRGEALDLRSVFLVPTKTTGGACNYLGDLDPLVSPLQVIYNPRNYDLAGL